MASGGTNLPKHNEDSGQTLGWWGVPPGPFLVLPFLGPATVRDAPARIADDFSQPFRWYNAGSERWISLGLSFLDRRVQYLPLDETLARTYDPYVFVRDAYLQRRLYLVFDGNPPQGRQAGEEDWEAEALRESEEPARTNLRQPQTRRRTRNSPSGSPFGAAATAIGPTGAFPPLRVSRAS